ncbi:MAG: sodium ion-translocating decarboxylase subunit beta [Bacteroidaceae bacterium]|nr:sodium ion-translocating decarboxylase subunit beta [Bacteroidaceae bacterium]
MKNYIKYLPLLVIMLLVATPAMAFNLEEGITDFVNEMGFVSFFQGDGWKNLAMIAIGCVLLYLAIKKGFEPLLLLPIAFGMILANLPGAGLFHSEMWNNEFLNPESPHYHSYGYIMANGGLLDVLYIGVKAGVYPCLIFLGVGAMTDFGPLIANPKSLLLGAAAQVGIFATFIVTQWDFTIPFTDVVPFSFTPEQAASIGIIGGADGPTAIFLTSKLAPELLGPIAVAAYSYMALVPVIQPPIMRALTSKQERLIRMSQLRTVSKKEKIIFPIVVTVIVSLIVPSAGTLVGCLMLGNLMKECGMVDRLSKTAQNELNNIVVIFLGITVGATATASSFLNVQTISILCVGIVAFGVGSACGVLMAKFMNLFLKEKINPLIGSAGVSAVPMAARVSQQEGQKEDRRNFLLMHAMGPNVAGVIGSAVAAGLLLSFLS